MIPARNHERNVGISKKWSGAFILMVVEERINCNCKGPHTPIFWNALQAVEERICWVTCSPIWTKTWRWPSTFLSYMKPAFFFFFFFPQAFWSSPVQECLQWVPKTACSFKYFFNDKTDLRLRYIFFAMVVFISNKGRKKPKKDQVIDFLVTLFCTGILGYSIKIKRFTFSSAC